MQTYKVLIADDEMANLNGVAYLLAKEFPEIEVVAKLSNGQEVVDYLEQNTVDIAFLDIRMPLMDGLEVAEYIYTNSLDILVVIMTGYREFEYAKKAIDLRVSAFLEKPFDMKLAVEKIREVCEERKKSKRRVRTFDEQINISKTARLMIENLMLQKQNEIEMLNEIVSCYTKAQLIEFLNIFLERIDGIIVIDKAYYTARISEKESEESLLQLVKEIGKTFVKSTSSEAYNAHNMKKIEKYIEEHCGEDLTLKNVADKYFYNYSYLSRVFKEKKGKNFSTFLLEVRMNKAKELLSKEEMNATDVAGMVGYSSYTNFRKVFKNHTGVSPSQYVELQRIKTDEKKK